MEPLLEDTRPSVFLPQHVTLLLTALGVYLMSTWIYNLYFHPLAGFPGPKIAAASGLYEFYYDVVKKGQYLYKIEEMHRQYDSHLLTEDHHLHRRRRKPLEPFFSRIGIIRMEEAIISEARSLNNRLEGLKGSSSVICLDHVFTAFAADVIAEVCYGSPSKMMTRDEFGADWYNLMRGLITQSVLFTQIPQLVHLTRLIPTGFLHRLGPGVAIFNEYREMMTQRVEQAQRESAETRVHEKPTLFRHIMNSDMPASEQSVERLTNEAMVIFGGATGTIPHALALISYYILSNQQIRERLGEELAPLMSDYPDNPPKSTDLEKLPYLQAIMKEGLRLSYGVMRRLPRRSPDVALQYKQWTIPKGTPVGMGAYSLHTNSDVYPEPFNFIPERWLGAYDPRMNESWVPFSRGSRKCLGSNLAMAEISWALAVLFRPNGPKLSLWETDRSDITPIMDFHLPLPKLDSRGCRVMVE
ncbi:hypothetical protein ANO14919_007400 [Xylariales sp. No.14919]|nr:hypothetical protein ANO14919_007400 [Xylariales sp. No.14919]